MATTDRQSEEGRCLAPLAAPAVPTTLLPLFLLSIPAPQMLSRA